MVDRASRSFRFARSLSALIAISAVLLALPASVFGQAPPGRVLILEPTVTGGAASIEATTAASLGFAVDIVSPTTWATLTAADFARYRAIILGDPTCRPDTGGIAAAEANASVWGPAVTGNVVIIATDATYHATIGADPGARVLISNAVAHATALSGTTGAYISLSCYYFAAPPNTPVPLLNGFSPGGFTVEGSQTEAAHITEPTSPVVAGLTDATLSNWIVSIHEVFDTWPSNFKVLVVATESLSKPYILSRGPTLPTAKDQCKDGGWRNFSGFKNQGDCVSFVATGGKNPPARP